MNEIFSFLVTLGIFGAGLAGPILAIWWFVRSKHWWSRIAACCLGLLFGVMGFFTLGPHMMVCWYSVDDPEYSEDFSKMASSGELPYKGMYFSDVVKYFEKYKDENGIKDLQLCRKCERNLLTWINYYQWYDAIFSPRWKLPVCVSKD